MNTNTYVIEARKGLTKRNRPTFYRNLRKYERGIRLVTTRTAPTAKNYIGRIEAEETRSPHGTHQTEQAHVLPQPAEVRTRDSTRHNSYNTNSEELHRSNRSRRNLRQTHDHVPWD